MKHCSRRAFPGFALVLALAIGGTGAQSTVAQMAGARPALPMAEEVYQNIHVLNGTPWDQLIPTMQMFAESLGIECEFCHEQKLELDGKPAKQITRKMLEMVFALNREPFAGSAKVTCYSCHRGAIKPVDMPILSGSELPPQRVGSKKSKETTPAAIPTVDQLLDQYVAALGGTAALEKISTRVEKGTVTERRPGLPDQTAVQAFAKFPNQRYTKGFTVAHLGNGDKAFGVYIGDEGWLREGTGPVRVMWSARVEAAKLEDSLNFPRIVKQLLSQLRFEGTEEVGGREAYVVSGRTPALPVVKLYFDKKSGLLARLAHYNRTLVGLFPTQIDYGDYRTVDGVKIPFRWSVTLIRGRRLTYQLNQVQQNIPIEEAIFAKPTPPPVMH